jgi:hypothetical protein
MMKNILLLSLLAPLLAGCAGLGQFTGNAAGSFVDATRRPVYVEPRPYYPQPYYPQPYRPYRPWRPHHWHY